GREAVLGNGQRDGPLLGPHGGGEEEERGEQEAGPGHERHIVENAFQFQVPRAGRDCTTPGRRRAGKSKTCRRCAGAYVRAQPRLELTATTGRRSLFSVVSSAASSQRNATTTLARIRRGARRARHGPSAAGPRGTRR